MRTAILVDGGFYRRRAQIALGDISAQERAFELANYCKRHLETQIDLSKTDSSSSFQLARTPTG